jgi:glycosyltransferase involved in cell wall biosynthesis
VPDGDIMGFAEGALTLMGNVDLANSLGSAGRRFVEAQHSWAHSAELLEEIFQSLVAERGSLAS